MIITDERLPWVEKSSQEVWACVKTKRAAHTELAHPKQLTDGLLEVNFPDRTEADLVVVEVSTFPERRAEEQAARDAALVWLDRGVVPEVVISRVRAIQDVSLLRKLIIQAGICSSLDAFRVQLP